MIKKIALLLLLCGLGFNLSAQYYQQSIGIRMGTAFAATYKNQVNYPHAFEIISGFRLNNGRAFTLAGLYQYHWNLGVNTQWDWFLGAGGVTGFYTATREKTKFGGGLLLNAGIQYTFRLTPVTVSLDYQPVIGTDLSYAEGAFSVRYTFGD